MSDERRVWKTFQGTTVYDKQMMAVFVQSPKIRNLALNPKLSIGLIMQVLTARFVQHIHSKGFTSSELQILIIPFCTVWFLKSCNNLISLVALMACKRCKLKMLVLLELYYTKLWQLMNLWYIDSNSCGHCRVVLSIIGFVKYFGLMLHAYHRYKVHIYHKSSSPINYWIQSSNPFPLSLRVKGLQRFVFLIIWWMMKIYDTHECVRCACCIGPKCLESCFLKESFYSDHRKLLWWVC